eukprot:SM000037S13540  [mRNA]  locus=s37:542164:545087:+ [translate_table: standard]
MAMNTASAAAVATMLQSPPPPPLLRAAASIAAVRSASFAGALLGLLARRPLPPAGSLSRSITRRGAVQVRAMGEAAAAVAVKANPLLAPYQMGDFELSHRMVLAPLTRCRALGTVPQPAAAEYYAQRASPGTFLISEATCVAPGGHGYPNTPGIYTREQIEAWKPIVKAVKDKGGIFFLQLWHVGRASHPAYQPDGGLPMSSSAIPVRDGEKIFLPNFTSAEFPTPREMTKEDIEQVTEYFRQGARNALEAGFDGVEIHGANGYIIDQFIKDGINKRTDEYGGTPEKRARFCLEVVDAVVKEVGAGKVGIRFSPFGGYLDATDSNPHGTNVIIMNELNKYPLLYIHVVEPRVLGGSDREGTIPTEMTVEPFRKAFKGTYIAAGGFQRESGMQNLAEEKSDLICYGRLWLANPDLPRRFELDAPLNKYDRATFYSPDQVKGYLDYPFLDEAYVNA